MISEVDIRDWEVVNAVNGIGWEVQRFVGRWIRESRVYLTKAEAAAALELYQLQPGAEFRVYETLEKKA